ncbi:hypothetical protein V8E53_004404 [Lactarius tabidus]
MDSEKFGFKVRNPTGPNADLGNSHNPLNARTPSEPHLLIRVPPDYPSLHRLQASSFKSSKLRPPSFSQLTPVGLASPTFVLESCHRLTFSFRVPSIVLLHYPEARSLSASDTRTSPSSRPTLLSPYSHPPFPPSSCLPHSAPTSSPRFLCSPLSSRVPSIILLRHPGRSARNACPSPSSRRRLNTWLLKAPFTPVRAPLFVFPVPCSPFPIPTPLACPPSSLASPWFSRLLTPALPSGKEGGILSICSSLRSAGLLLAFGTPW